MPGQDTQARPSLVWFRQDLRVEDNPALLAGCEGPVVPVFIWSPEEEGEWAPGSASRWWLHQSLLALNEHLARLGSPLVIRQGDTLGNLRSLVQETGARTVYWNRRYEPKVIQRDAKIKKALREDGLVVESFNGSLLREPWEVETKEGNPYQVYTPFWKACQALPPPAAPQPAPRELHPPDRKCTSTSLDELQLEPRIDWAQGIRLTWTPGWEGAHKLLHRFLEEGLSGYHEARDRPDWTGTSALSPHLHFGEISPRTVWHRVLSVTNKGNERGSEVYQKELYWREFASQLLYHFPATTNEPLRSEFAHFPWKENKEHLRAWQRGQTGYPLVDAGMRQLWTTGWMHNRVRMVVASFLVKDLHQSWLHGARWFWDTLVDADLANNTLGWQWSAGCGADAAPFFRIFNPTSQAEKFDPEGEYIHRWVPELAQLPTPWVHKPWEAPADVLEKAGIRLEEDYPLPIVDHAQARKRSLEMYESIKENK